MKFSSEFSFIISNNIMPESLTVKGGMNNSTLVVHDYENVNGPQEYNFNDKTNIFGENDEIDTLQS